MSNNLKTSLSYRPENLVNEFVLLCRLKKSKAIFPELFQSSPETVKGSSTRIYF